MKPSGPAGSVLNALAFAFALLLPQLAAAQQPTPLDQLLAARSLRCVFDRGTQGLWVTGELILEQVRFGEGGTFVFDSIDTDARTARLIGNVGAEDVSVTITAEGITFVERTAVGNVNITTVFGEHDMSGSGRFVAVHSRHQILFGEPFASQFHGTCTVLE